MGTRFDDAVPQKTLKPHQVMSDLMADFIASLAETSRKSYRSSLKVLVEQLGLQTVGDLDASRYREWLAHLPGTPATVKARKANCSGFMKYLETEGYVELAPRTVRQILGEEGYEQHRRGYAAEWAKQKRERQKIENPPATEWVRCAGRCGGEFERSVGSRQIYHDTECRMATRDAERSEARATADYSVSVTEKRCCSKDPQGRHEVGAVLPASAFRGDRGCPDGLEPRCAACTRAGQKVTEKKRPRTAQKQTVRKRLRLYNIVVAAQCLAGYDGGDLIEAYDAIYDKQQGICPWCRRPGGRQTEMFRHEGVGRWPVDPSVLVIDHDHQCCPTGESCGRCVRRFMHRSCNLEWKARESGEWQRMQEMAAEDERLRRQRGQA